MGVPFRIVLYATDGSSATNAAEAAFARIQELDERLSDYDISSELSQLSRTSAQGRFVPVSKDLWFLLERSQRLAAQTLGAFDVTVGPVVNLWRKARRERALPTTERLTAARRSVGYTKMLLRKKTRAVQLTHPDMRLDLGGIAKGYAADEALRALKAKGIDRALVAAAGDIAAGEAPPGKKGWLVDIAPIDHTNAPSNQLVFLRHAALATSGDVYQRLEIDGIRYSHIVDPRTGIGLTNSALVTVLAQDGTTADSLATAVSVLGVTQGLHLVEQTQGVAAYIAYIADGTVQTLESKRFEKWKE